MSIQWFKRLRGPGSKRSRKRVHDAMQAIGRRRRRAISGFETLEDRIVMTFSAATDFAVGNTPEAVTVGDFNGDSIPDLAIANRESNNVSVLLGTGTGSFATATNFAVGTRPHSVTVGDFNGDGKPDLATANISSHDVSVLLGTGTGTFGTAVNFTLGGSFFPRSVTVGEFNGDGKPDLATANYGGNSVSVLLGTGTGSFDTATNFAVGTNPISVTVGEFNGDGKPDLATANRNSNNVSVLLGTGTGTFGTAVNFAVGTSPQSVTVRDFNGDGRPDLATANVNSNNVSVLLGDGAGAFGAATNIAVGARPHSVTVGDFNGDGKPDLATANLSANNVSVLLGTGTGTFGAATNFAAGTNPISVTVGDFNGDGKPDLATANRGSHNVSVLLNAYPAVTSLPFQAATSFAAGNGPAFVTVGDFNGDGKPDLVVGNNFAPTSVSVLLGTGTGSFSAPTNFAVPNSPISLTVGDFNGDGKPDIATANRFAGNVSVLLGNGSGGFAAATNFTVGNFPVSVTVGDFNGDGKPDLAAANQNSNNVSVLLGNGAGSFGAAANFTVGTGPDSLTVGDFNGDGKPDLAAANRNSNSVSVLLGNGAGSFAAATNFSVGTAPSSVIVRDFNGDGKPDLATANYSSNNVSVLLANGAGSFGAATNFAAGLKPGSLTVGDFNGDGKPDLATANYSSNNNVSVLLGNGAGGFGTATNFAVGLQPLSVTVADFNGDGKPDLAAANVGSGTVSVLLGGAPAVPAVNLSVSAASGTEAGQTVITVTATAASAVAGAQTVSLAVTGTGIAASDYALSNSTITIPNGATTGTATFTVRDDLLNEGNETATLTISSPSAGITLGTTLTQNITITDNDNAGTSNYGLPATGAYRVVRNGSTIEIYNSAPVLVTSRPLGTDPLVINGTSGNDSLTIDFGGGNFTVPITFNGGSQTSTPGDILNLTGGSFATGAFAFTNANDGTIDLNGNSQISYTGLEPIVTTGTTINDLILTFNGGAETITLTDATGAAMTIDSPLSESLTFANPSGSLTINAGTGDDIINITSVDTAFNAALTINGDAGNDTINLNAAGTYAAGKNLTMAAETITVNAAQTLGGAGAITLTAGQNIVVNANLTGGDGGTTLLAQGLAALNTVGVTVQSGAVVSATGTGNVSVTGTGGNLAGTAGHSYGVRVSSGVITSGGTGTVTVVGNGGGLSGTGSFNYGVYLVGSTSQITSSGGNVRVTGTGGGSGSSAFNHGVRVEASGVIAAANLGTVTVVGNGGNLTGTGGNNWGVSVPDVNSRITSGGGNVSVSGTGGGAGISDGNHGVRIDSSGEITSGGAGTVSVVGNGGNLTGTGGSNNGVSLTDSNSRITSGGGNVSVTGVEGGGSSSDAIKVLSSGAITTATNGGTATLVGNSMHFDSSVVISAQSGSSVTLRQRTNGVAIALGSGSDPSGGPLSLTDAELDRITAGTINIGDANSGAITVSANISREAAANINVRSSVGTTVNSSVNLDSAGGTVSPIGSTLTVTGSVTGPVVVPSGSTMNGTGTITGNVSGAGSFSPGNNLGVMTIVGNFTPSGTVNFGVNSAWVTAGTDFDQYLVTGLVNMAGSTVTFTNTANASAPALNSVIKLIDNNGTLDLTTAATTPVDGASVTIGGRSFKLFYNGGDGNDVVLVENTVPTIVYVDDNFTQSNGTVIADADLGTSGSQPAIFGLTAFTSINAALAAVTSSGTMIVNGGTYAEAVSLTGTRTMEITGPNSAQTVIIDDLTTIAGTPVVIEGSSNLTVGDADSRTLAGVISGSGSFTKQGTGTYTLSGSNLYTGATNINIGTLRIAGAPSAPAGAAGIFTFDSVSGSTINNAGSAGTAKNGALVAGSAVVGGGRFGNAMSTSGGTGARMDIAASGISLAGGNWTGAAWFNNLFSVGDWRTLFVGSGGGNSQLIINNGSNRLGVYDGSSSPNFRPSPFDLVPAANSGWNHVAAVGSGTTTTFYLNGVSVGTADRKDSTNITSVGASPAGGGMQRFAQLIDDVYIYQSALTAAEILTLYNSGAVTASNSIPDSSTVTIAGGAFLDLNGSSETIGSLAGAGTVTSGSAGSPTLTVGGGNGSGSFSGTIQNGAGTVSLAKSGSGAQTLAGSNLYTGATAVNNGTLEINGSVTSNVTVTTPGVLNGSGTVTGNVLGNGTFSPGNSLGNSAGIMTIVGNFTPTGTVNFEVNSAWTTAGTHFDQYLVTGLVSMAGSTITFTNTADASTPPSNSVIKLIDNNGTLDLTTAATTPVDGASVTIGSRSFKLFYNGGDGNDLVMTTNTAPTAANSSVSTNEDITYTFLASDFNFSDADSSDVLSAVKITTIESAGDLEWFNGSSWVNVTQDQEISKTDIDTNRLRFVPDANANGSPYSTFGFNVKDTGGPVLSVAAYTLTITVSAINDLPVAQASSVTTNEDTAKPFAVGDFLFTDVEDDSLASITISSLSLASGDTLKLSGADVTVGQTITVADIPNLVYTPDANAHGEARSTFGFTANDASSGTVAATMTINVTAVNDVSIGDASVTEGGSLQFNVSLENPVDVDTVITYSTASGSATTADSDYTSQTLQTLTIPAGQTSRTITIVTTVDTKVELDETMNVHLIGASASGQNVTIDDGSGQGTIQNNDTAIVSISNPSVTETNSGTTSLAFTVSLDQPVDVAVSATINTADGTTNPATTDNSDYVAITDATLMFSAGSTTSQSVNVTINGDSIVELNEQLQLVLSALSASGRSVQFSGAASTLIGTGTIINDDAERSLHFLDPNPNPGNQFGATVVALSGGNVVITSPLDDAGGLNAGAVYLFNGATGALISTLKGSKANDRVGIGGVTALSNGNYVVMSALWDNGAATDVGAVTFGSGTTGTGVSGSVSAANSLVGTTSGDMSTGNVTALSNGNYVVINQYWDNGTVLNAGAVTFGSGTIGVSGEISATNSLVGTSTDDIRSDGVIELTNGNYVVNSPEWNNGAVVNAGAVTFGSGTMGVNGAISATNSLVGSTTDDAVGNFGVTALSNGNYVVNTVGWDNGAAINAGAVTFGSGTTGVIGAVSASNSLVGTAAADQVGRNGVTALSNGNYVVTSQNWNGTLGLMGAATFANGLTGISGPVSTANSLVGSKFGDGVGAGGATALSNGNYVVISVNWRNNFGGVQAGAVTFGNGTTGIIGVVSSTNSLIGSKTSDRVGVGGVRALSNGNYVVMSPEWDNGSTFNAGAVTFGDGTIGVSGVVSTTNSLVGTTSSDMSGVAVTALSNGNYVVRSANWDNGAVVNAGAVTFGSGTTGVSGAVSATNSLVGSTSGDMSSGNVTALSNGNYVVSNLNWDNGAVANAGAVTFGSGTTGVSGAVSASNSLVGTRANDNVGIGGVTTLSNGNYVVGSQNWDNGAVVNAGAATFGSGSTGVSGAVSATNSLVGTRANDNVGIGGVTALSNGNYVVRSQNWDNGTRVNAGAITFGNGSTGVSGTISATNSAIGATANTALQTVVADDVYGYFIGRFVNEANGKVRLGSQVDGFADQLSLSVDGPNDGFAGVAGQLRPFTLSATSPSASVYQYSINWGDGSAIETISNAQSVTNVQHRFLLPGTFNPIVTVYDGFDTFETTIANVVILSNELQSGVLAIGGTDGGSNNDSIIVTRLDSSSNVSIEINGRPLVGAPASLSVPAGGMRVYSGDGTDGLVVRGTAAADVVRISAARVLLDDAVDIIVEHDASIETRRVESMDGDDTVHLDGGLSVVVDGGIGNDTIQSLANAATTWNVSGANSGTVSSGNQTTVFSNTETLRGGDSASDAFTVAATGSLSGSISGGSGSSIDRLSTLSRTAAMNIALQSVSGLSQGFSEIESFVGSGSALTGPNSTNTWTVAGPGTGTLSSGESTYFFSGYATLNGGTVNDTFRIPNGLVIALNGGLGSDTLEMTSTTVINRWDVTGAGIGSVGSSTLRSSFNGIERLVGSSDVVDQFNMRTSSSIDFLDGGSGPGDTLSYSNTAMTVNIGASSATGVSLWVGLDRFAATAGTLIGATTSSTWNISGPGSGTVETDASGKAYEFAGFSVLTGGAGNDRFQLPSTGSISTINGGLGIDTIDYSSRAASIRTVITAYDASSGATGNGTNISSFSGVESFLGSSVAGDLLQGPVGGMEWWASGNQSGRFGVLGSSTSLGTYSGFDSIQGGSGVDSFTIEANGYLANISGGTGSESDLLVGPNNDVVWQLTGVRSGTMTATGTSGIRFSNISNLTGGSGADTFAFYNAGSVPGTLNPGGGENTLSYEFRSSNVAVILVAAPPIATSVGTLIDDETNNFAIVIGGNGNDVLVGSASRGMVLVGGPGNDIISGGTGRDILIGGLGADTLSGGLGQDIIIGGRLTYDANVDSLRKIRSEWIETRSYAERIANLRGDTTTGLNGLKYLSNSSPSGDTLLDDSAVDSLYGGSDLDWLIGSQSDMMPDWETIAGITERKDSPLN